jgi:hypothetical protein
MSRFGRHWGLGVERGDWLDVRILIEFREEEDVSGVRSVMVRNRGVKYYEYGYVFETIAVLYTIVLRETYYTQTFYN